MPGIHEWSIDPPRPPTTHPGTLQVTGTGVDMTPIFTGRLMYSPFCAPMKRHLQWYTIFD
eukprot:766725-Hanusia_phi.AAC.2